MSQSTLRQSILPHLLAVLIFSVLTYTYAFPLIQGKMLQQHDVTQAKAMMKEVRDYNDKTGEMALWTNSMFGGMPSYQIWLDYPTNLVDYIMKALHVVFVGEAQIIFLLMAGFYFLLFPLTGNVWLSIIGAIAFCFGSYNMISLEAGHVNKVRAMALIAPILGSIILAYRGKFLLGAVLLSLFLAFQIRTTHLQITYYTFISSVILVLYFIGMSIKDKKLPVFMKATGTLVVGALLAVGANTAQLWVTLEYSTSTIRAGKSELSVNQGKSAGGGLDKDYAQSWSYGIGETMTLLIPNYRGGGSSGTYEDTKTYDLLVKNGAGKKQANQQAGSILYWGNQPFTSGPVYFGAIVCFLFVFGMFIIRSPVKWVLLALAVITIFMAWGRHFALFNDFLFYNLPMYDKFRTPSMILTVTNVVFVLVGILGVHELLTSKISRAEITRKLSYAVGGTLSVLMVFGIFAGVFNDFSAAGDTGLAGGRWPIADLEDDRVSLLRADAFRSILFILVATGIMWGYVQNKLKAKHLYIALGLLILFDVWSVSKRYLNDDDFVKERVYKTNFTPSQADQKILADTDPNYRVLDLSGSNPFTNASPSYFHKSVGGYHAAKIRRYNELIEMQIKSNIATLNGGLQKDKIPVLNMLNTKYFIVSDKDVIPNPHALGNVWLVDDIQLVANADAEMASLSNFDPAKTVFIDQRYKEHVQGLDPNPGASASINLTSYEPNGLKYEYNADSEQFAVFSEVYYNSGKGWDAYVDGKPAEHIRVNYVLRGMRLPAGQHTVEFKFRPRSYYTGSTITLICSGLILITVFFIGFKEFKGIGSSEEKQAA